MQKQTPAIFMSNEFILGKLSTMIQNKSMSYYFFHKSKQ